MEKPMSKPKELDFISTMLCGANVGSAVLLLSSVISNFDYSILFAGLFNCLAAYACFRNRHIDW